jgi:hypothetical protein
MLTIELRMYSSVERALWILNVIRRVDDCIVAELDACYVDADGSEGRRGLVLTNWYVMPVA